MAEKSSFILVFAMIASLCYAQEIRVPEPAPGKVENPKMTLDTGAGGHESLLSPKKLTQFRSLSLGYTTNGKSSVSMMSYLHGFDYVLSPRLKTKTTLELSRLQSGSGEIVELTPTFRMDWRPFDGGQLTLNLRLPAQRLYGAGLNSNIKANILRR